MTGIRYWLQFKKLRLFLAWFGGILLFLCARTNERSFRLAVPLILAGELIRVWSLGFLEKKGKKLATNGPFAYVRNPLYVGNFFIGLGVAVAANRFWLIGLFMIGFVVLYGGTVEREEKDLLRKFGETYSIYVHRVPRFFPRFGAHHDQKGISFQWSRLIQYREYVAVAGLLLFFFVLYLFEEVIRGKEFFGKEKIVLALTIITISGLIFEWVFREYKKLFGKVRPLSC